MLLVVLEQLEQLDLAVVVEVEITAKVLVYLVVLILEEVVEETDFLLLVIFLEIVVLVDLELLSLNILIPLLCLILVVV
tara:strand:+ start:248 stop:484 length:237 start_codon:yes stop_codon:yes gene_type:complete